MDPSVLGGIQARHMTIAAIVFTILTIIVCYVIAVALGHVPVWLPMISDCAVLAPEKYIFRVGMITAGNFIALNGMMTKFYMGYLEALGPKPFNKGHLFSDNVDAVMATISGLCLALVAACDEDENNSIHSTSAVIFFALSLVWMIEVTLRLRQFRLAGSPHAISLANIQFKAVLCLVMTVMLVMFAIFSQDWGKHHIQIAEIEWLAVFLIQVFLYSMTWTMPNGLSLGEVLMPSPTIANRKALQAAPAKAYMAQTIRL